MAMDYWEPTEMEEANMSMGELWKRRFTPMVCGKCGASHRTVDCGTPRWAKIGEDYENLSMEELFKRSTRAPLICDKCGDPHKTTACTNVRKARTGEPNENWTMLELEEHYSSSRRSCNFLGYPQESEAYTSRDPPHFSWRYNGSYHNSPNPRVYEEASFRLPPPSPEVHDQLQVNEQYIYREEFEEMKESIKSIEVAVAQLVKLMECQPQENMPSLIDECPNEPMVEVHTKDEEEEFVKETNEEEDPVIDHEVMKWVSPILAVSESNPDVMTNKEALIKLYEQEEKFMKVDFVVEFLPEQYLKIKRQRDIEFILRIKDKDRKNKRSRNEEATSKGSRSCKMGRALRGNLGYTFKDEPGTMKEHDPDTMPFDPGG